MATKRAKSRSRKTGDAYERTTELGRAMLTKRGQFGTFIAGKEMGLSQSKVSRIERGLVLPSLADARAIARWLGWSLDRVADAVLGSP